MKVAICFVFVATVFLLTGEHYTTAQDVTTASTPPSGNANCGGHGQGSHGRHRVSRSASPTTLEEKFKDFSAKLGKTPDEVRAAFGKFMLGQGISVQQMQESLQSGHEAALQLVESIKKAMQS